MAEGRLKSRHVPETVVRVLGWAGWAVILLAGVAGFLANPEADSVADETILVAALSIFFVILLARVVLTAVTRKSSRARLIPFAVGIVLFAAGSAVLNGTSDPSTTEFPAPGEWLFISAYVAWAAFLVLDANQRRGTNITAWLDAIVLIGAVSALAGAILLTPFEYAFPQGGLPLFAAVLYPMLDLAFAVVVVGQWALSARAWNRATIMLGLGFLALALADSTFVLNLSIGTYNISTAGSLLWGVAFMLMTAGAIAPKPPITAVSRRLPSSFLVVSFLVALALLLLRPEEMLGWAIAIPAALTLLATGARLVLALQESRRATEAFHLARTDDLTGLPNRRAVLSSLDEGIRGKAPLGLMLLDLDGFKDVNDTLGHSAGDTLLELVALRMRNALPSDMMLCRLGGDEFAIVAPHDDQLALLEQAQEIRKTLLAPAKVDGMDLAMHASVGITVRQDEDARAADLLRRADVAMYEAKVSRGGAQLYDAQRDEFSRQRLKMGEELRRGIARGEVVAWYQPKVDALSKQVVGLEALVRWDHPDRGMIAPMAFLSVARRSGLMQDLSEVVIRQATNQAAIWRRAGLDLNVAVNLAPTELLSGTLLPVVYAAIEEASLPSHVMTIEVTEDSFLADPERARDVLIELRRHGLKTSIDDYGTGFSSLAYLRDLPLTELKLDRTFVANVTTDDRSRLIVESTVTMAHALDLRVVAEGVENQATEDEVVALGVDILQGYHQSPPMPAGEVQDWVLQWNGAVTRAGEQESRLQFLRRAAGG
jgi:diguanylate cyclase (GGDEF)-like protein